MSETTREHHDHSMSRVLGRFDVLAVAFGAMIGFGWIVLTGGFLKEAGTLGAVLAFVLGGIVVLLVGLCYAELVAAMPHVGGEHNYVLRAMGSRPAFFTSWTLVLGYVSVVAFEAVALPQTLLYLFPDMLAGRLWTVADYDVYASWVAVGVGAPPSSSPRSTTSACGRRRCSRPWQWASCCSWGWRWSRDPPWAAQATTCSRCSTAASPG